MGQTKVVEAEAISPPSTRTVKLSANLPRVAFQDLKWLADERDVTMTEALRDAIDTEKFLREIRNSGGKVLIEEHNGQVHEVRFR